MPMQAYSVRSWLWVRIARFLILGVLVGFDRRGRGVGEGNIDRRSIRQYGLAFLDFDLAEVQRFLVDQ